MARKTTAKANKIEPKSNIYKVHLLSSTNPSTLINASSVAVEVDLLIFLDENEDEVACFKEWRYFERL